jgi:hypothetical protein
MWRSYILVAENLLCSMANVKVSAAKRCRGLTCTLQYTADESFLRSFKHKFKLSPEHIKVLLCNKLWYHVAEKLHLESTGRGFSNIYIHEYNWARWSSHFD